MEKDGRRFVWVLGAGFSAGLGGPLLPRLLSRHLEQEVRWRYPAADFPELHTAEARAVRDLYDFGLSDERLRSPNSGHHHENIWSHAEDFLDYLDTAAAELDAFQDGGPCADRIREILQRIGAPNIVKSLRFAVRRMIAAECSAFLEVINPDLERWQPYRSWLRSLGPNDTVISFNYDRVIERLIDAQNKEPGRNAATPVHVAIPGTDDEEDWTGQCLVLKLHGSVDWKLAKDGTVKKEGEYFAMKGHPAEEIGIATPGPSKKDVAGSLKILWDLACERLKSADVIVFVGYRFPETDAEARGRLLSAIRENDRLPKLQPVHAHLVLGRSPEDVARLAALLRFAVQGVSTATISLRVKEHPLFAQDFFTVARREAL